MITCSKCHESKPEEAFTLNRARPNGYANECKACKAERETARRKVNPFPGRRYTMADLSYRPIEHVIEYLPIHTLAKIWGVSKDSATRMKQTPAYELVDTWYEITDERVKQLRDWVERRVA